jgi:hypothetical protein
MKHLHRTVVQLDVARHGINSNEAMLVLKVVGQKSEGHEAPTKTYFPKSLSSPT